MERYENVTLQQRVGHLYMSFAGIKNNEEMRIVDAGRSMDEVAREMLDLALECIAKIPAIGPLRTLGPLTFGSE